MGQPNAVAAQRRSAIPAFNFEGRFLLAVSDADMLPSAYLDGLTYGVVVGSAWARLSPPATPRPLSGCVKGSKASAIASPDAWPAPGLRRASKSVGQSRSPFSRPLPA
ncbi:MAG: hypothetical protein WKG07_02485 [Hymenobacter sp.]